MLFGIGPLLFDSLKTGLTEACPDGDVTAELFRIEGEDKCPNAGHNLQDYKKLE